MQASVEVCHVHKFAQARPCNAMHYTSNNNICSRRRDNIINRFRAGTLLKPKNAISEQGKAVKWEIEATVQQLI